MLGATPVPSDDASPSRRTIAQREDQLREPCTRFLGRKDHQSRATLLSGSSALLQSSEPAAMAKSDAEITGQSKPAQVISAARLETMVPSCTAQAPELNTENTGWPRWGKAGLLPKRCSPGGSVISSWAWADRSASESIAKATRDWRRAAWSRGGSLGVSQSRQGCPLGGRQGSNGLQSATCHANSSFLHGGIAFFCMRAKKKAGHPCGQPALVSAGAWRLTWPPRAPFPGTCSSNPTRCRTS